MPDYLSPSHLSDAQIASLLAEPKPVVDEPALLRSMKLDGNQHWRASERFQGEDGSAFALHIRRNALDPDDFSVILSYEGRSRPLNLRRHNGPNHPHRNKLEGTKVDFVPHVHIATHRYQEAAFDAEGYAEATEEFADLAGALRSMILAAAFHPTPQATMF
ncbi:MAG TPA: hypothetical protein VF526_05530 [Solirubrobacteraceae bacterium]|jgi:hypothetical protein